MASKKVVGDFYKQLKLYERRLKNIGKYRDTKANKDYYDLRKRIHDIESEIQSGIEKTKDIKKITKEIAGKKYKGLAEMFEMVDYESGEYIPFSYRKGVKDTMNIPDTEKLEDLIDYDTTLLREIKIYLDKKPQGITKELLDYINELISKYGEKELARRINEHESEIPELNKDTSYEEFKGLFKLFTWLDGFMMEFQNLNQENNIKITEQLEELSYNE